MFLTEPFAFTFTVYTIIILITIFAAVVKLFILLVSICITTILQFNVQKIKNTIYSV